MSIKSLVQSLYKLSGSQAMPTSTSLSFTQQIQPNSTFDYVCPSDGYFTVSCPPSYAWISLRIREEAGTFTDRLSVAITSNAYPCGTITCKKGQAVQIGTGASSGTTAKEVYCRFVSTVGAS